MRINLRLILLQFTKARAVKVSLKYYKLISIVYKIIRSIFGLKFQNSQLVYEIRCKFIPVIFQTHLQSSRKPILAESVSLLIIISVTVTISTQKAPTCSHLSPPVVGVCNMNETGDNSLKADPRRPIGDGATAPGVDTLAR